MKLLIIAAVIINFGDDRGGVATAVGETVDVTKDTAATLTKNDRALYVNRKDDPSKEGRHTASEAELKAAKAMAAGKSAEDPTQ